MNRKLLKTGVFAVAITGLLSLNANHSYAQSFGQFGSGVFMKVNGTDVAYSTSGSGANAVGSQDLPADLGTFQFHTGSLILTGAEMKTYKGNYANVCGVTFYYNVRAAGTAPNNNYQSINLPYKAGCNGINFTDGLGPCSGNDQKWSTQSSFIHLSDYAPGDYILDIYYEETGSSNHNDRCNEKQYYDKKSLLASTSTFHIIPRPLSGTSSKGINNIESGIVDLNATVHTYPSPVSNVLNIEADNFENGTIQMQVTNIQGATSKIISATYTQGQPMTLDMSSYAAGMYFIRIQQGAKVATAKIVKQ